MRVQCPRCGKIWCVCQGNSEIECDCHTYCEEGSKQGDCVLIADPHAATTFKRYVGLKVGSPADEYESEFCRKKWCSTHERYTYKTPVLIRCDWDEWLSKRAPKKFRDSLGLYP